MNVDGGQGDVSTTQLDQLAAGLRLDGVIACLIALAGWVVLTMVTRRTAAAERSPVS